MKLPDFIKLHVASKATGREIQFKSPNVGWMNLKDHPQPFDVLGGYDAERFRLRPEKREGWVNVYHYGISGEPTLGDIRPSKEAANANAKNNRVACIHIEYTVGEGLESPPAKS